VFPPPPPPKEEPNMKKERDFLALRRDDCPRAHGMTL
jgi:hypothetical protein